MNVLYVVGLGPGGSRWMTWEARAALEQAEVLCGYTVYLDLIRGEFPDKEYFSTPMTQEIERCRAALERARSGRTTALVCSGDAGVYGMAGPVLELAPQFPEVEIQVVPGVTAALAGAAVLGAPLMHDFTVLSLSDLLTPWEVIRRRLELAAQGDFVLCLYNPSSRPVTSCWPTGDRRRCAAGSGTRDVPRRSTRCSPWGSCRRPRWICSPPYSSAPLPPAGSETGW